MADILNLDELTAPIEGENPAGVNLREDYSPTSAYLTAKTSRNAARVAERKQLEGDSTSPDWSPLMEVVPEAIATQSKDLEMACWLSEALVRKHGFAGLRDGFRLARELVEKFWDGLHPMPDEDGMETRVAALAGLNGLDGAEGTLISPINNVPLTGESAAGEGPYAHWHYKQAANLQTLGDEEKVQERIAAGAVSMDMIEKAEAATPVEFCQETLEALNQCIEEFDALTNALEERCGSEHAPPSAIIRNTLEECREIVTAMVEAKSPGAAAGEGAAPSDVDTAGATASAAGAGAVGPIRDREDAFRTLQRVAQFFKETEPHSPVSYALERIVKWGRLSLPDLLQELISDESSRSSVYRLVGIQPPDANGNDY